MSHDRRPKTDHWTTESYKDAAGFVPQLTTTVISYLDAQPYDHILDIGCGDGILTAQIAKTLTGSGKIHGLDASASFIATAKERYQASNCTFDLQDCTVLEGCSSINGQWNKIFSNAALHWILQQESTRQEVMHHLYRALKPGGRLVFEMGGKGNVAEIHAAFNSALLTQGLSVAKIKEVNPWFFPSTQWMSHALTDAGFRVKICELEYRPTQLTSTSEGGTGLVGWLKLMGAQFLDAVPVEQRESVLQHVQSILENVITREEDESQWIGYVRLRAVASKPISS